LRRIGQSPNDGQGLSIGAFDTIVAGILSTGEVNHALRYSQRSVPTTNEPFMNDEQQNAIFQKMPPSVQTRVTTVYQRLASTMEADAAALVTLKGHLILEEQLSFMIERIVLNPEQIAEARLSFAQKRALVRAMFPGSDNQMWDVIGSLNKLRNVLAHSLQGTRRVEATKAVRASYRQALGGLDANEVANDFDLLQSAIAHSVGYLIGLSSGASD
jgi:hypothetical protein